MCVSACVCVCVCVPACVCKHLCLCVFLCVRVGGIDDPQSGEQQYRNLPRTGWSDLIWTSVETTAMDPIASPQMHVEVLTPHGNKVFKEVIKAK